MNVDEHIELLQREGDLLADAASAVDPDARVPTCPEWKVRDLVRHVGGIHRWAASVVREQQTEPVDQPLEQLAGGWPEDAALVDWFRTGHAGLVAALTRADPDLVCWSFLPAPSPLAFWARRQTHETGIHRADAQSATGAITPFAPEQAADGIDEILNGFAARPLRNPQAEARHLQLRARDLGREWLVQLGPDRVEVRASADGWVSDCTVDGSASDLFLLLWNRRPSDALDVSGDAESLTRWREAVSIRWTE